MKNLIKISLCLILIFILCSCSESKETNKTVFTVNGEAVTQNEIDYFTNQNRSRVMSKFITEYGAEINDTFWQTEFDGQTPQEYLDALVQEKAIKAKIQLVLCRENGIYEDISYESFYNLAIKYNEENSDKLSVGINTIPLDNFYDYYIDNGVMELKNILGETKLSPTTDELNSKIKEIKDRYKDKDEEELTLIAKEILVEEKYNEYTEDLYQNAKKD